MITTVKIVFHGLVLLLSGAALDTKPAANIFAAVAIEDNVRPEIAAASSYGVTLPIHDAVLHITGDADAIGGVSKARLETTADGLARFVVLSGDRIQFGGYTNGSCEPASKESAGGAMPAASFKAVPHMSRIVPDVELLPNARPIDGYYGNISQELVSAWMDLSQGKLTANVSEAESYEREFRPSHVKQVMATEAVLEFKGTRDTAVCIMVTPFGEDDPDVVIKLPLQNNVTLGLMNMAREPLVDPMGVGVIYDFELFYRLLKNPPCLAPIPYYDKPKAKELAALHPGTGTAPDPPEGAVCGPMQNH